MIAVGRFAIGAMAAAYGAGAVVVLLARSDRSARWWTAAAAIAGCAGGLAASLGVLVTRVPVELGLPGLVSAAGGVLIRLDPLGAFFLALVAAVGLLSAVYGMAYTEEYDGRGPLRVFGLMFNLFLLGMSLVPCAGNVFTFLLAWELMAVSSYFLVMTDSDDVETRRAGLWYAGMTHLGLVLLLPMFVLLAAGSTGMTFADLRAGATAITPGMRNAVFVLALVAFGSKAGLVPLHVWLPRAHPAAPSHVSALMSGVMIKLGIYGFIRVVFDFMAGGPAWWGGVLLAVGAASALLGVLYALMENDLKRLLAYSSVENVGIIVIGLGAGVLLQRSGLPNLAALGYAGALLHTLNHACFKALLFLSAGSVLHQTHTRNMEQMGGLIKRMPHTAACFLVGSAAIAALPPLNGFASEWLVFQSLLAGVSITRPEFAVGFPIVVGMLALTSGLAAAAFVKAFGISFLAMPRSDRAGHAIESPRLMRAAMAALAGGCVALGLGSPLVIRGLSTVIASVPGFSVREFAPGLPALWLTVPNGTAQVSPVVMAISLAVIGIAVFAILQKAGLRIRRADTWGCGRISQTPRMEYTSSAFAEPLRRVFAELYRPTEDLSVSTHPEASYLVQSMTYSSAVVPWFEQFFYDPVVRSVRWFATRVRRLQAGSLHLYLLYVTTALVVALTAAWWFK